MDYLNTISENLNTLTEEAQKNLLEKIEEFKFNPEGGEVGVDESLINLNQAKHILTDAIQNNRLNQLPISLQKDLARTIDNIIRFRMSIVNGSDDVINLVNSIEDLYTKIWTFGLHNLSSEVLGYVSKMNQLKAQEVRITELIKELEIGKQLKGDIEIIKTEVKQSQGEVTLLVSQAKTDADGVAAHYQRSNDALQTTTALQSNIDIQNTAILKTRSRVKTKCSGDNFNGRKNN